MRIGVTHGASGASGNSGDLEAAILAKTNVLHRGNMMSWAEMATEEVKKVMLVLAGVQYRRLEGKVKNRNGDRRRQAHLLYCCNSGKYRR